jgi:hypothetical protein
MGFLVIFMDPKVAKWRPQRSIPLTFELIFLMLPMCVAYPITTYNKTMWKKT